MSKPMTLCNISNIWQSNDICLNMKQGCFLKNARLFTNNSSIVALLIFDNIIPFGFFCVLFYYNASTMFVDWAFSLVVLLCCSIHMTIFPLKFFLFVVLWYYVNMTLALWTFLYLILYVTLYINMILSCWIFCFVEFLCNIFYRTLSYCHASCFLCYPIRMMLQHCQYLLNTNRQRHINMFFLLVFK